MTNEKIVRRLGRNLGPIAFLVSAVPLRYSREISMAITRRGEDNKKKLPPLTKRDKKQEESGWVTN